METMSELDALHRHMNYCRGLLKTPPDEVLGESIKQLLLRVNGKDEVLRECLAYLDTFPLQFCFPRPDLIARCKQALEK